MYVSTFNVNNKKKMGISLSVAFLYACSDEIHQYFVPGMYCEFRDVCIDLCGAFCGMLISIFFSNVIKTQLLRNKLNKKESDFYMEHK